jgi:hypothetical protein
VITIKPMTRSAGWEGGEDGGPWPSTPMGLQSICGVLERNVPLSSSHIDSQSHVVSLLSHGLLLHDH